MAGIGFVDGDNVECVVVEGAEPFFSLLGSPIGFDGRDVVEGLGGVRLEGAGIKPDELSPLKRSDIYSRHDRAFELALDFLTKKS